MLICLLLCDKVILQNNLTKSAENNVDIFFKSRHREKKNLDIFFESRHMDKIIVGIFFKSRHTDKIIVDIFFKSRHTDKKIVDIWMSEGEMDICLLVKQNKYTQTLNLFNGNDS